MWTEALMTYSSQVHTYNIDFLGWNEIVSNTVVLRWSVMSQVTAVVKMGKLGLLEQCCLDVRLHCG